MEEKSSVDLSSGEDDELNSSQQITESESYLFNIIKKQSDVEEENDIFEKNIVDQIEQHAGSALDQAQQFIDDF